MLPYRHISEAAADIVNYIYSRRSGQVKSLRTRWHKFNNQCMGGIEPNTIYTIAGVSGSGKSSFLNSLESDLFDLNPKEDFIILSFNFEMLSSKQVGRKISYRLEKTTQQLYSGLDEDNLSDQDIANIEIEAQKIGKYPIYYVDISGTIDEIRSTVLEFSKLDFVKDKWLVITLDHALLTKSRQGEKERETLANLQYTFMELKKYGRNTIIQLSQMNREIEGAERMANPSMHFPSRRDIFGSEALFQASDYVIVMHRPELLQLRSYGVGNWPVANMIYLHFLKNREGDLKVLSFVNNLKYNRIDEYNKETPIIPNLQLF
jgi:replicative DNA helicase